MAPVGFGRKMALMNGDRCPLRQTRQALGLILLCATAAPVRAGDFPELRGPYLGQQPPESGVEVFAPGVIEPTRGFHSSVVFNAAGDTACWTPASIIEDLRSDTAVDN
jgi:hypothetical protein